MGGAEHSDGVRVEDQVSVQHHQETSGVAEVGGPDVAGASRPHALVRAAADPFQSATPDLTPRKPRDQRGGAIRGTVIRDNHVKVRAGLAFKGSE